MPAAQRAPGGYAKLAGVRRVSACSIALVMALVVAGVPARAGDESETTAAVRSAVELGVPAVAGVSCTEVVVAVPIRVKPVGVSGTIEGIAFSDMALNGIPFEVEPYAAEFDLPKDEPVTLEAPLRLRVRFSRVAPGVFDEAIMPSDTLRLTGKATIHGTFRKWIFTVRRTVDVEIEETRDNPIASYHPLRLALAELRRLEASGFSLPFH